jgi:sugar phosphate isomerase/epimerase
MSHHHPESDAGWNRRQFLHMAGTFTLGAACGPTSGAAAATDAPAVAPQAAAQANPDTQMTPFVRIGILLGTFGGPSLEARLDKVKSCGLDCIQVSLDCAGGPLMPDQVSPELAGRIRREAGTRGIRIPSVQGTFNMSHPDAEQRRAGLRRLRVLAEACPQMGTKTIHLCTGTRDRDNMWRRHPDNDTPEAWKDMAASLRAATDMARETGVVLAFEPEVNNVVDSARKARRLLDEIGSPHLKVTIDPANLFHTGELPRMREMLDEAFALLSKDIVLAHAKDLDHDGDAGHKAAGEGKLDYDRYLSLLRTHGFKGPLLLHGLSEAQVPGCVAFLREKMARLAAALPQPGK